jgi:hypothetical protein
MGDRGWRYDLGATGGPNDSTALEGPGWPIPPPERSRIVQAVVHGFDDWIATIADEEDRRIADLAAAAILGPLAKTTVLSREREAARCEEASIAAGRDPADFVWAGPVFAGPVRPQAAPGWALAKAREVRQTIAMFGLGRAASALVRRDRWLVRPSPFMREAARDEGTGFLIANPPSHAPAPARVDRAGDLALAALLRESVLDKLVPESEHSSVYRAAFSARLDGEFAKARRALLRLRRHRGLPSVLWVGSGGNFATRALGLEVRRRGGTVRRFVHGGGFGLDGYGRCRMLIEACGASEIVVPTRALARSLPALGYASGSAYAGPSFAGWSGDPLFRAVPAKRAGGAARTRIVYMGSIYTDAQLHVPPVPPAGPYLAWQAKLAAVLGRMGHDVVFRPHPENTILHGRQPLERFVPISRAPFSEVLANASLMIFDYCFSTAFWEALCSDVPVVYLDMIGAAFQPDIHAALSRRAVVVDVAYDARNRPVVDREKLSEAMATAARRTDPHEFRQLLAEGGR